MLPHRQVQPQLRDVLQTIPAVQRRGDLAGRAPAASVAQLGQHDRISLARNDGAEDLQAGHAGDVAEDLGQLEVHEFERLLHALDVLTGEPDVAGALPDQVAQGLRGLVGLKHGRQQAVAVQSLNPLAIAAVGLGPPLNLACEGGRRRDDVEARFEQGQEQDVAVGAGGFEGDVGDAVLSQPGDEQPQAGGVGGELAHGRVAAVGVDADPVRGVADVDAGRLGMAHGQRRPFGAVGRVDILFRHDRLLG